jgi:integrase
MPYKRGQKWYAQVRKDGIKKERVFQTKKEAVDWEAEMRRKPVSEWLKRTDTVCLADWAQQYLDFSKTSHSIKVYKEKRFVFRTFFKEVDPAMPVSELKPATVMTYVLGQKEQRSGHAANKDRKNLVAAWNWGMKYMDPPLPGPNPCLVERMPEIRQPRYIPPEEDFWKVYDAAEGQDKVMLLTYLHLAARRAEIFRLSWEDVDFGNSRVRLGTHKRMGGSLEYDWLPLTDDLFNTLLEHRQTCTSRWVFLNPKTEAPFVERKRWMKALCRDAGVKHFGLHAIRHLSASILAKAGVPTIQIQAILRHKKIGTTERYLHQLGDLKAALQLLSINKKPSREPSTDLSAKTKIRLIS